MPKYVVCFERYDFYSVPIEAASKDEARERAWAVVDSGRLAEYQDYMNADLADENETGFPNVGEVDDACFERFRGVAA